MIEITYNILITTHYPLSIKLKLLYSFIKIDFSHIKNKETEDAIIKARFLNYQIESLNYDYLRILLSKIFIGEDYHFKSNNEYPLILDCGANIGIATLYFKWLFPKSKIFAFEPDERIFNLLKKNIENNNLLDVELINAALSDERGIIQFYKPMKNEWNFGKGSIFFEFSEQNPHINKVNVKSERLSDYIKKDDIDFIKMDIEGAETIVINELIHEQKLKKIKEMAIKYHFTENTSLVNFLSIFERNGFHYQIKGGYYGNYKIKNVILIHFYHSPI
jgi:FkbM family methyltransferase